MANVDTPQKATAPLGCWPRNRRHALFAAAALWVVPMVVIAALVFHDPMRRTVTLDSYHRAAQAWWAGQSLYIGPSGMNYLPHFAVLYAPFHLLPLRASEILWRLCAAAVLAAGLWRLMRELFAPQPEQPFFWTTLLAMPLCLASLRDGNANAIFGGVTLLAIVATLQKRWWPAAGWMALAIALKPLGIVLLLLSAVFYGPIARRLPAVVVALAVFPFLFGSPDYVWSQYREAWNDLRSCAAVTVHRFADLNGLLRTFGAPLPPAASTAARLLCGALTAALWRWGAGRLERPWRVLWLYALTTAYLMVFNPMNEENSYVILAPALGAWAVCFLFHADLTERWLGWAMASMLISMDLLPNLLRPLFGNYFALFWLPLMTLVFVAALAWFIARSGARPPAAQEL